LLLCSCRCGGYSAAAMAIEANEPARPIGRPACTPWTDNGRAFKLGYSSRPATDRAAVGLVTATATTVRAAHMRHRHENTSGPLARATDRQHRHHAERISSMAPTEGARDVFLVFHVSRVCFHGTHVKLPKSIPVRSRRAGNTRDCNLRALTPDEHPSVRAISRGGQGRG